jgi:hypothetical protein
MKMNKKIYQEILLKILDRTLIKVLNIQNDINFNIKMYINQ